MSFWKNLFAPIPTEGTNRGLATAPRQEAKTEDPPRIFLSNSREIDLYELEELCDAVGWARRPIRKVKKAIEHSFLVVTMWQERGHFSSPDRFCPRYLRPHL